MLISYQLKINSTYRVIITANFLSFVFNKHLSIGWLFRFVIRAPPSNTPTLISLSLTLYLLTPSLQIPYHPIYSFYLPKLPDALSAYCYVPRKDTTIFNRLFCLLPSCFLQCLYMFTYIYIVYIYTYIYKLTIFCSFARPEQVKYAYCCTFEVSNPPSHALDRKRNKTPLPPRHTAHHYFVIGFLTLCTYVFTYT